jgi:hypothetical protein
MESAVELCAASNEQTWFAPSSWARRSRLTRFGPLFLEPIRMMVNPGVAGMHVQPCPRNNIEPRATSCELGAIGFGSLKAHSS